MRPSTNVARRAMVVNPFMGTGGPPPGFNPEEAKKPLPRDTSSAAKTSPKAKSGDVETKESTPVKSEETSSAAQVAAAVEASGDKTDGKVEKKLTLGQKIKKEVQHYWDGTKLLGAEVKISSRLALKMAAGYELTRRENRQLQRTVQDLGRLVPFSVFIIVPFAELLLPIALKLFPNLLPSTYEGQKVKDQKATTLRTTRKEVSGFLRQTLKETGLPLTQATAQKEEFSTFFRKVRATGEKPTAEDVIKVCKIFKDDVTLDNLSRPQLVSMCRYLNLNTFGTDMMLRYQIRHRMRQIKRDDRAISYEGVDSLLVSELQIACASRGIRTHGVSPARLREDLQTWIDLRIREGVPSTLLTQSDNSGVSSQIEALTGVLSSIPEELFHEIELEVHNAEGAATNKQRLEVIKEQQELIQEELEQNQGHHATGFATPRDTEDIDEKEERVEREALAEAAGVEKAQAREAMEAEKDAIKATEKAAFLPQISHFPIPDHLQPTSYNPVALLSRHLLPRYPAPKHPSSLGPSENDRGHHHNTTHPRRRWRLHVMEDDFSNVSWHSDQHGHPGGSASAPESQRRSEYPAAGRGDGARTIGDEEEHLQPTRGDEILECTISEPHKENDGTKDAYVSYTITTHSTFSTFQRSKTVVRRRFTDFFFLYKVLCRDYQGCAVPPLPDKQRMEYVRGDRFGPDFTARRAYSLQRFLSRLSLHPILRRAKILHDFLESPDWNATMRSRSVRGSGGGGGVFDSFTDTFMNAFAKVNKQDPRFIEVKEKSDKLDEDLNHVEKVVARVARRENDLETDLRELAEQFQKLLTLEPGVESAVIAFAASVEDTAQGLKKLKDHTDQDYLGSLRDMVAYSGALKNLLKAREQKQLDFEQLTEYLNKGTAERDMLAKGHSHSAGLGGAGGFIRAKIEDVRGVDHEQARRDRQRKLELRIDELTREVEIARSEAENFGEQVVREVDNFESVKRIEFKRQMGGLADAHIDFYDGTIAIWERYVVEMEKEGAVLPA
ncbi:LETM1-like protein-domain-containing protein [Podospora conica]|nr:LETM1-like protein-domain-containing protein [Schizothecium conicum]